ncbi:holo-ACP synthase [Siminovitchia sp. FSL H7-0308]|uniref:Holo-[acyl-carrier-protein] synthase n=1 Tax=Siminovitchia thermophila TaxID=1245522 RepID=A0ABS2R849_9BACI|nr:holo-ACP synthase [Siminovitchia thermophila]MBM7715821.1 holo-[acyl-carrier protein] synthase [Siminovitchia thermophila]ONK23522.1 holo-ACP synthase [Bacillus sp. VT-16-64]
MIAGIGLDLVELDRIERLRQSQPRFPGRILTQKELMQYDTLPAKRKTEFLAGRFAAKEAFAKALGTGIGKGISFMDIEIGSQSSGKPFIAKPAMGKSHVSITHTKQYAAAQVIIEDSQ